MTKEEVERLKVTMGQASKIVSMMNIYEKYIKKYTEALEHKTYVCGKLEMSVPDPEAHEKFIKIDEKNGFLDDGDRGYLNYIVVKEVLNIYQKKYDELNKQLAEIKIDLRL